MTRGLTPAIVAVAAIVTACSATSLEEQPVVFRVLSVPNGGPAMETAARVVERYLAEERYVAVVYPGLTAASEEQKKSALSIAPPQVAFRESDPTGPAYVGCWVHEPVAATAAAMRARCEAEIRAAAASLRVELAPRSGF